MTVSQEALTPTTLPTIPGARDDADLVGVDPSGTPEAESAAEDYGPWSTAELIGALGGEGSGKPADLLALALSDIEGFWEREFDELWGFGFVPVENAYGYDSQNASSEDLPECVTSIDREVLVNAFYCVLDDSIVWDHAVLFPFLEESSGYLAAAMVLAHEYGHAIQARLGTWLDPVGFRADVVLELQADCYEGAWLGDLIERGGGALGIGAVDVDRAFASFTDLADAPGSRATDISAHGTSFDRMSAFRQGFIEGVGTCVRYVEDLPTITSAAFSSAELENLGNLALGEVLPILVADLERFWAREFESSFGAVYQPPEFIPVSPNSGSVAPCAGLEADPARLQGLATYCPEGHVIVDTGSLLPSLEPLGDLALSYPIVHAWGQQVLIQALGNMPPGGPVLAGDCMSGVWLRGMWDQKGQLDLSAGDIDEAIATFGVYTPTGPAGEALGAAPSTLDRVGAFGRGFLSGTKACIA